MDRMRKPLLVALGVVTVAAVAAIGGFMLRQRASALEGQIARYQQLVLQMERASSSNGTQSEKVLAPKAAAAVLASLRSRIAEERGRYYAPGAMTTSRFAARIEAELESDGLTIIRYRPIENAPGAHSKEVEFLVQGTGTNVLSFLENDLSKGKYRYLRDVSIHAAPGSSQNQSVGTVNATLRLAYETIDNNSAH